MQDLIRRLSRSSRSLVILTGLLLSYPFSKAEAQNRNYFFETLTIGQGLSHNSVFAVLQDRNGFMWFGTQNGLNRYDGYGFKTFGTGFSADPQFEGRAVTALLEDREGNLWVGTTNRGINIRFSETGRFLNVSKIPALSALARAWVSGLMQDKQGRIWIATFGQGLFLYAPPYQTLKHFRTNQQTINSDYVFEVVQDESGQIWAVTGQANFSQFDAAKGRFNAITPAGAASVQILDFHKTMLADQHGSLWISSDKEGLFRFDVRNRVLRAVPSRKSGIRSGIIRDLEADAQGNILIATDGSGLLVYDPLRETFSQIRHDPLQSGSLNTDALYDILIARDGNLWISTFNGGLNVHKPHKIRFATFSHTGYAPQEISHSSVLSLLETKDQRIWAGTDGGGLNLFHPETRSFTALQHQPNHPQSPGGNVVKALYEDAVGRIWIGFYDKGMDRYDPATGTFRHYPYSSDSPKTLSNNNVWSITGQPDGTLWIATLGGGLNRFDPQQETFTHYLHDPRNPNSPASNDIMIVFADRENRLWLGTQDQGLDVLDLKTGRFSHFRHDPRQPESLSGDEIRAIFQDSQGRIWIGTEDGGLNRWLGNGHFRRTTTLQGLMANSVVGITEDDARQLWVTTLGGVSRLNLQNGSVENFTFQNMPQPNQFNQAAVLYTRSGALFLGGINGLNMLNARQWLGNNTAFRPKTLITDLKIFNNPVLAGWNKDNRVIYKGFLENAQTIHLSYLDNAFSFDFATLDFNEPNNHRFLYRLEDFHDDWQVLSLPQHTVSFTNLEPGTYTFRVKGTDSSGKWSTEEATVQVVISPPFWKTLWFRLALFGLAIGSVVFGVRLWIHRRERELRERMDAAEREVLQLRNEKLTSELDTKNTELVSVGLQMAHKNDFLNKVKQELEVLPVQPDVHRLLHRQIGKMIEAEIRGEDFWERFTAYFNELNHAFMRNLTTAHPDLSPNDLKICSLMMINLNTKEMASILNITVKGVEKSRYRLKKKLGLSTEDDLLMYVKSFARPSHSL